MYIKIIIAYTLIFLEAIQFYLIVFKDQGSGCLFSPASKYTTCTVSFIVDETNMGNR